MLENVDGRQTTDAGIIGILLAHPLAFGPGELQTFSGPPEGAYSFPFGMGKQYLYNRLIYFVIMHNYSVSFSY